MSTLGKKVLIIAPRFFDKVYGEKRAMMSAYKTALSLSQHMQVVVVTAGPLPRYERVSKNLTVYRLWDWFLPDPVNYGVVPGIFSSLVQILRTEKPDAILINKHMFFTSLAAPFLRLMGKRVIIQTDTFPGINWFPRNPIVKFIMQCYAWTIGMIVLKSAHKVVLLHEGLEPVAKWLGLPFITVHNGVDLIKFERAEKAKDIVKQPDEIAICYVGRLETVKGYDDLLQVASSMIQDNKNIKFYFVGSTEGKEDVVRQYSSKQIIFTGHRQDIPSVLKNMDIFVLPSYSEGLPNALMEAMAAGCACIASNVGGVKVLLSNQTGLLFRPGDQPALSSYITRLVNDSDFRQSLGKLSKARVEKDFNLNQESHKLTKILLEDHLQQPKATELYESSYTNPRHFSFGKNWQEFLTSLNEQKIEEAKKSLIAFLGGKDNISGKTFVDIGCGSGLFSLAAYRLGAKKVVSVDIDDASVACARFLHQQEGQPPHWKIQTGSALDESFLKTLGHFDLVYSWGVLHHTGDMYQALRNITNLPNNSGKLYIALYNDNPYFLEGTSRFWLTLKKLYNTLGFIGKKFLEVIYTTYYVIGLTINRMNPISYIRNYHSLRGMSFIIDIRDWLGGYPYEYATVKQITDFYTGLNFNCVKTVAARSIGCNEFLFTRNASSTIQSE